MVSQSAQKFNEYLDHSLDLQAKLRSIKSPLNLSVQKHNYKSRGDEFRPTNKLER